jgi:hypothetical protein
MRLALRTAAWLYGLQAFMVVPWFLGATYRREQSMWLLTEYERSLSRFGPADAALCVYLYLIFYASFFLVPLAVLELLRSPLSRVSLQVV